MTNSIKSTNEFLIHEMTEKLMSLFTDVDNNGVYDMIEIEMGILTTIYCTFYEIIMLLYGDYIGKNITTTGLTTMLVDAIILSNDSDDDILVDTVANLLDEQKIKLLGGDLIENKKKIAFNLIELTCLTNNLHLNKISLSNCIIENLNSKIIDVMMSMFDLPESELVRMLLKYVNTSLHKNTNNTVNSDELTNRLKKILSKSMVELFIDLKDAT
jgi:hypothetical protein